MILAAKRVSVALVYILLFSITGSISSSIHASPEKKTDIVNVIVSKDVKHETISESELVDIFTRKKLYWADRSEIIVISRKFGSIPHRAFISELLGITPYEYRSRLERNLYQGRTKPPIEVNSEEELVDKVSNSKNAIGYIYDYMIYKDNDRLVIVKLLDD